MVQTETFEQQVKKLKHIFQRIQEHNMTLNIKKVKLFETEIEHVGFKLGEGNIAKQSAKIQAFDDFKSKHYSARHR